ncbi:MAG: hypothetical protein R6U50_16605 [Desulfobacterales bacterium]
MKPKITFDMTLLDVIAAHPETEAVFKRYDKAAGECICCNSLFETLASVSLKYNFNAEFLIEELKKEIRNEHGPDSISITIQPS